ncbi:MAG: glycosyltransferase family 87 protein [Gemmataceae bacterium]
MKRLCLLFLALGLVWCYRGLATLEADGDFRNHRAWGRMFLAGDFLYHGGLNIPYTPYWALVHAPLALLSEQAAFRVHLTLGLLALGVIVALSVSAARQVHGLSADLSLALAGLLLLLSSRAILRDLQDGGANLIVIALTWSAVYCWLAQRNVSASLLLGQAVALKCTPALLLLYFVWRRQWRVALLGCAAAVVFLALPLFWQGPASFGKHLQSWFTHLQGALKSGDPRIGVLGPEEVRNLALKPTLGRILVEIPALELSPASAAVAVLVFNLLLAVAVLWWGEDAQTGVTGERIYYTAALLVLMLLISPITWLPHCVAVLPALALTCAAVLSGSARGPVSLLLLSLTLILLRGPMNPALVGVQISAWLQWAGATTWAIFVLLLLTLRMTPRAGAPTPFVLRCSRGAVARRVSANHAGGQRTSPAR